MYTYNVDTDYCHQVQVAIGVVSRDDFISHFVPGRDTAELVTAINALTAAVTMDSVSSSKGILSKFLGKG